MPDDFRVAVDVADHPKTVKMTNRLGEGSFLSLLRLWGFTAKYRPKGVLQGMNIEDIEIAAKWTGETGRFVAVLLEVKFLDKLKNNLYRVHDWRESNGWVYFAPERREKAQKAANSKHTKSRNKLSTCSNPQLALLKTQSSCAPSPTPSPTPSLLKSKSEPVEPATPPVTTPKTIRKIQEADLSKSEMRQVTDHWMAVYSAAAKERSWQIEKYAFADGKDGKIFAGLMRTFGAATVVEMISAFFASDDEWLSQHGGFTVGVFKSQFNKLAQQRSTAERDPNRKEYLSLYATFQKESGRGGPFDVGRFLEYCRARNAPAPVMELIDRELGLKQKTGAA